LAVLQQLTVRSVSFVPPSMPSAHHRSVDVVALCGVVKLANQQLLVRVVQEQINQRAQITKLLAPLWLAVIALGALVGLMWK
jgi:hypothetical protein